MSASPIFVAIDGPSASGKSTVARGVARALGYVYADSGAIYRTLTWAAQQRGVDLAKEAAMMAMIRKLKWELKLVHAVAQLWVDGYYPEKEIRTAEVSAAVPIVAALPKLRQWVVAQQRAMAQFGNLVMEGRDIGNTVFPAAQHKFFLEAHPEVRAARRQKEGVQESLTTRDHLDSVRSASPLQRALDATVVDTSQLDAEQVVLKILALIQSAKSA